MTVNPDSTDATSTLPTSKYRTGVDYGRIWVGAGLAAAGMAEMLPFTVSVVLVSQAALAALNLVLGLLIAFLVPVAAGQARR